MGKLRVLSRDGDRSFSWDPKGAAAKDPGAEEAVRQAERIFNEARVKGATAFRVSGGVTAERLDTFDPQAEQIVVVPRMAGG